MDNKKKKIMFLVILLLGCALTSIFSDYATSSDEQNSLLPVAGHTMPKERSSDKKITVYVSGAVLEPGMYELPQGSRALDAVEAAGGLTSAADRERVNLARNLKDGNQVNVPVLKQTVKKSTTQGVDKTTAGNAATAANKAAAHVRLNTASTAELETLPGVGPALAQRIVAYRQGKRFSGVDDLLKVKGIGKAKLERLRPLVEVD